MTDRPIHKQPDGKIFDRIGEKLSDLREARDLTQTVAAKKAGISRQTLRRVESGENISMRTFIHLLRVYGRLEALEDFLESPAVSKQDVLGDLGS